MFEFCRTSCCATRGVEDLMDYASEKLGVKRRRNHFRRIISICRRGMFRACGYAPMLQLGDFIMRNYQKINLTN